MRVLLAEMVAGVVFGDVPMPDASSLAGLGGLAAGIAALGMQIWSTRRSHRVEDENRSLAEAWRNLDAAKVEIKDMKAEMVTMRNDQKACHEERATAVERVEFLTAWLEDKGIKVPRRRPPGMTDSDAAHTPLPPGTGGKV